MKRGAFSNAPLPKVREAVDFLHYYAGQVRDDFDNRNASPVRAGGLYQSVELPAGHFHRQNRRRAGGGATRSWRNRRADIADCRPGRLYLLEAGVPPGVVQLLPGRGKTVGAGAFTATCACTRRDVYRFTEVLRRCCSATLPHVLTPGGRPIPLIAETGGMVL